MERFLHLCNTLSKLPHSLDVVVICSLQMKGTMGLQKLLHPFFLLLLCSYSYCILQEDPLSTYKNEASVYSTHAYPTYFRKLINNGKSETSGLVKVDQVGSSTTSVKVVNVDDYGAKGDGRDDTEAFNKAWNVACSSSSAILVVPQNKKYLLKPITFSGPCKSELTMMVYGTIEASDDRADYESDTQHWLLFEKIQNLIVEGGGIINGNGNIWWQNSCKINKKLPCKTAPTALTFSDCKNLLVKNLKIKDSQQIHVEFKNCIGVQAFNLLITAPENSPNTDGIHVAGTKNIVIKKSVIKTGDDCISIVSASSNVQAADITCGPGHGISIGSLGADNEEAHVTDVLVDRARLSGTTNGVRIKTWPGGSGSASKIIFQNISMYNVTNPIIIDQNYCDEYKPCNDQKKSAVQVKQVMYKNIKGTSASEVAVKFDCSKTIPCSGISLQDINLVSVRGRATASCENAKWNQVGSVFPNCA